MILNFQKNARNAHQIKEQQKKKSPLTLLDKNA
jgi:hypothetical protein